MKRLRTQPYHCPTEFTLDVLGGKWKTVILCHLKYSQCRYAELRALIPTLSDKILTERLKELIDAGLIERAGRKSRSVGEVYRLTPHGETLGQALGELYKWGSAHAEDFGVEVLQLKHSL